MQRLTPFLLKFWLGVLLVLVSLWLFAHAHYEFALASLALGFLFAFTGAREHDAAKRIQRYESSAAAHLKEALEAGSRGQSPGQVAEAFERKYKIPPTVTLMAVARETFRRTAEERDPERARVPLAWLASDRDRQLAPAADLIAAFDVRRNLFAASGNVQSLAPNRCEGVLVAARQYLYFFALEEESESIAMEVVKGFVSPMVPGSHLLELGSLVVHDIKDQSTQFDNPATLAILAKCFDSPHSYAVPWTEVAWIGKEDGAAIGRAPRLVVKHGDHAASVERRFELGSGRGAGLIDAWIDRMHLVCALNGKLLAGASRAGA